MYKRTLSLFCVLLVTFTLTGCTAALSDSEKQEILDYVASTGAVYVDQLTDEQLQRLYAAGMDGVDAELRKMVEEYVSEHTQEPVLGPTVELLRSWQGEKDGYSFALDLSRITSSEYDELMVAYQSGGAEAVKARVEQWWADGWDAAREVTG